MDVREYLIADGKNPYREWLDALDVTPRVRIQARVLRFSTGNLGDHKSVGGGVWEARVMFGRGIESTSARTVRNSCSCCSAATSPPRRWTCPGRRSHGRRIRRANVVARRSEDWNVGLAKDLRDAAFAREFLLAAIDDGVDLQLALGKVIRAMGVKEFAAGV